MTKYFLTSQIIEGLKSDDADAIDEAIRRLKVLDDHVNFLKQRLDLAEKVIGELYLLQEETTR